MSGFEYHDIILLQINNNTNGAAAYAGEHWSFLAIFKSAENAKINAVHCCSVGRTIPEFGKKIVERLTAYLNYSCSIVELTPAVRQKNSFDCGIFALYFTQVAAEVLSSLNDNLTAENFQLVFSNKESEESKTFEPSIMRKMLKTQILANLNLK